MISISLITIRWSNCQRLLEHPEPYASADIANLGWNAVSVDASECPWNARGRTGSFVLKLSSNEYLDGYAEKRNDPALSHCSHLSPYLSFWYDQRVSIYNQVKVFDLPDVRFSWKSWLYAGNSPWLHPFNPCIDTFEGLPEWARRVFSWSR